MKSSVETVIDFSRGGGGDSAILGGWSTPEDSGRWSDGPEATLLLSRPAARFGIILELALFPALVPPLRSTQVVRIRCNTHNLGTLTVDRAGIYAIFVPPSVLDEERLLMRFSYPNTVRPADVSNSFDKRELAIKLQQIRIRVLREPWRVELGPRFDAKITAYQPKPIIEQATAMLGSPLSEALRDFDALAGNCDMGLALRNLEYESLSFLRFGGATPAVAIRGLENGFAGLGEDLRLEIADNPLSEWMVSDAVGLRFHSGLSSKEVTEAELRKRFPRYIQRLRDRFLEDLQEGQKIFVFSDHKDLNSTRTLEYILPLYLAFREKTGSPLLWVCPSANNPAQRGSVRQIMPGLYLGELDLVAPPVLIGGGISVAGWVNVLCNAWSAVRSASQIEEDAA